MFQAEGTAWENTELRKGAAPAWGKSKLEIQLRKWAVAGPKALCAVLEAGWGGSLRASE